MRSASSPPISHHSSYIMEQIIRATLRDADALRVRCKQRNNLSDDGSPGRVDRLRTPCEPRDRTLPRHTRTILAVLSNGIH